MQWVARRRSALNVKAPQELLTTQAIYIHVELLLKSSFTESKSLEHVAFAGPTHPISLQR
jgi:hypothetical protein